MPPSVSLSAPLQSHHPWTSCEASLVDLSSPRPQKWTKQQTERLSRAEKFRYALLLPTSSSSSFSMTNTTTNTTTDIYTHISELVTELHNDFDTALWNRRSQYSSFTPSPHHPSPPSTPARSSPHTNVADGALTVVDMQKAKPVLGYRRTQASRLRFEVQPEDIVVAAVGTVPATGNGEGEDWALFCGEEYMEDPLHPILPIYDDPLPVYDDEDLDDDDGDGGDLQSVGWEMDWGGGFDGGWQGDHDDAAAEGIIPADDRWEGEREKEGEEEEEEEAQRADSLHDGDEEHDEDHAINNYRRLPRPQQRPNDKPSKASSLEKVVKEFWSTVDGVYPQSLDAHTPPDQQHHPPRHPAETFKHTLNRYDRYRQANKSAFMRNHTRRYYANQLLLSRLEIKTKLGANAVSIRTLQGDVELEDVSFST